MLQPSTLNAIGLKYGTDKASSHHNYLEFYELFFAPLQDRQPTILEIGVFNGASLKTWEEYFSTSDIIGLDITPTSKRFEQGRITIELADQSNIEELTRIAVKHGPFDIIIDDGSHMWNHQITSLRTLFPFLNNDGIYIVEDLHTNYGPGETKFRGIASSTCADYLKAWLDLRVADSQIPLAGVEDAFLRTYGRGIQFMAFHRRACLIKKRYPVVARGLPENQPLTTIGADNRSQAVSICAHVSSTGDVLGPSGFVNLGSDAFTFQGFSISTDDGAFEYRVRSSDGSWSAWTQQGDFAGTRQRAILLTGFAVRLLEKAAGRYVLRAFGRFVGSEHPVEVSDGQDCVSTSGGALCGIQVELTKCDG